MSHYSELIVLSFWLISERRALGCAKKIYYIVVKGPWAHHELLNYGEQWGELATMTINKAGFN